MSQENPKINNEQGYDMWSEFYDSYPNPTVATDEKSFPAFWHHHCGKKILEIGCGTGRHTRKLISHGNRVTGIDMSTGMLNEARKKIPEPALDLRHGDFLSLQSLDIDYDVIIESLVLEHIKDLRAFFTKAASCLKTGGDLYLSEIHPARTEKGILAHFKKPGAEEDIHLVSFPHREEEVQGAAQNAGFHLLNAKDVLGDESLAHMNPKWHKHLGQPLVRIWHFGK